MMAEQPQKTWDQETEETFKEYVANLKLTPEELDKKILDIGSGEGEFATWAKKHGVSHHIFSLDRFSYQKNAEKTIRGEAEELPFKDQSFDLIISNGSIPMLLYEKKASKKALRSTISELLRVVKKNGEIRLAPVANWETIDVLREHIENFTTELSNLEKDNKIKIEKIYLGDADYGPKDGLIKHFLYKIKKLK